MAGTAARHEPCGAWWPEPYLHVELGPRGGGLHHPVHHSDEGLALAHLRHTGKERAEVSGGRAPVLSVNRSRSPQDAKCHLLRWPRGSSCGPALLLFRSVPSGCFFGGENTDKTEPARSRRHRQTRAWTGTAAAWPGTQTDTRTGPGAAPRLRAQMGLVWPCR